MRSWCWRARARRRSATCATTPTPGPTQFATPLAQAQLGAALAQSATSRAPTRLFRLAGARGATAGEPAQLYRADYGTRPRDAAGVLALGRRGGERAPSTRAALAGHRHRAGAARSHAGDGLWTLLAAHALIGEARARAIIRSTARRPTGPVAGARTRRRRGRARAVANDGAARDAGRADRLRRARPARAGAGQRLPRSSASYFTLDGGAASIPRRSRSTTGWSRCVTVTPERDLEARLIVTDPLPAGLRDRQPEPAARRARPASSPG